MHNIKLYYGYSFLLIFFNNNYMTTALSMASMRSFEESVMKRQVIF